MERLLKKIKFRVIDGVGFGIGVALLFAISGFMKLTRVTTENSDRFVIPGGDGKNYLIVLLTILLIGGVIGGTITYLIKRK